MTNAVTNTHAVEYILDPFRKIPQQPGKYDMRRQPFFRCYRADNWAPYYRWLKRGPSFRRFDQNQRLHDIGVKNQNVAWVSSFERNHFIALPNWRRNYNQQTHSVAPVLYRWERPQWVSRVRGAETLRQYFCAYPFQSAVRQSDIVLQSNL